MLEIYNNNKAVAYSVLAHMRNSGILAEGPLDYFEPLVKRALHSLSVKGYKSGKSFLEISDEIEKLFSLEIPIPVLGRILRKIQSQDNISKDNLEIFNDNSFRLKNYHFQDYEQLFQTKIEEIADLNLLFQQFCAINGYKTKLSLLEFIENNKKSLLNQINSNFSTENSKNGVFEAKFINYFKDVPDIYELIKDIYLGSLISTYLEFEINEYKDDVELLLDTNFVISLLDLNTIESTKTCEKVIELSKKRGFKISLMDDTIKEIQHLLHKKAENISNSTLLKYVNPEDILNACERKGYSKVDIERIADNLQSTMQKKGFNLLFVQANTRNKAKLLVEYQAFKEIRNNNLSALHDATALYYVREKRGRKVKKFEDAKCWFVNNSTNTFDNNESILNNEFLKETIRADELLTIMWLSNPDMKNELSGTEFSQIGLNSMISLSLNSSLPKASIIKELEDNIFKYSGDGITEKDVLNLSTRITNNQIKNIQEINDLATNKDEFVNRIKKESNIQNEIEKTRTFKLSKLFEKYNRKVKNIDNEINFHSKYADSLDLENHDLKEELQFLKDEKENAEIRLALKKWRRQPWISSFLFIFVISISYILLLKFMDWNLEETTKTLINLKENLYISILLIIMGMAVSYFILQDFYSKYKNHSNIKAFKESLKK